MAPSVVTEDYYAILEVHHTATTDLIAKAYKRLALKLHPDRNAEHDATAAFQLLGRAYQTLKDTEERRIYDRLWPAITRSKQASASKGDDQPPGSQSTTTASSAAKVDDLRDKAQIAELFGAKAARIRKWQLQKSLYESKIFEINRQIRRVEGDIKILDVIRKAEIAEDTQKNSWSAWVMSPFYAKTEESEEQKADKERKRQERRIEKDMKERRLESMRSDLKKEEASLKQLQEQIDKANAEDDAKIRDIQARITRREYQARVERERKEWEQREEERRERERLERLARDKREKERQERERLERLERERLARLRRQHEAEQAKREQEEMDSFLRRADAQYAAKRARADAELKHREKMYRRSQTSSAPWQDPEYSPEWCAHDGWWPKVKGQTTCPECGDAWTYLLKCPGCGKNACPKCQYALRPRRRRY